MPLVTSVAIFQPAAFILNSNHYFGVSIFMEAAIAVSESMPLANYPMTSGNLADSPIEESFAHLLQQHDVCLGVSRQVQALREFIVEQAGRKNPVLLIGGRGQRKKAIAQTIHRCSPHRRLPFLSINTFGIGLEPLHHLLFGAKGVLKSKWQGTVFLNGLVHLLPLTHQHLAIYLGEVAGESNANSLLHPRLVIAAESDGFERTADNRLAASIIEILRPSSFRIPTLHERKEDIPFLIARLMENLSHDLKFGQCQITARAIERLCEYEWPGNFEELESVLKAAIASLPPQIIEPDSLPEYIRDASPQVIPGGGIDLWRIVEEYERSLIETALRQTNGNQTQAAQLLGLKIQTLNMKVSRYAGLQSLIKRLRNGA